MGDDLEGPMSTLYDFFFVSNRSLLLRILEQQEIQMGLTEDLRAEIVAMRGSVANMRADVSRLADKIAELLAQPGDGISQVDGEALLAEMRVASGEAQAGADQTPDDQPA